MIISCFRFSSDVRCKYLLGVRGYYFIWLRMLTIHPWFVALNIENDCLNGNLNNFYKKKKKTVDKKVPWCLKWSWQLNIFHTSWSCPPESSCITYRVEWSSWSTWWVWCAANCSRGIPVVSTVSLVLTREGFDSEIVVIETEEFVSKDVGSDVMT